MRLRAEDNVIVTRGKDRGKQGKIQQVFVKTNTVLVDGVNNVKRHTKPSSGVRQGGIIDKELPVRVSNVMLVCPVCDKATRIGYRKLSDGTKARICRKCDEVIE